MHDELGTRLREETAQYMRTLHPRDPAGARSRGDQRRRRRAAAISAALAITLLAGGGATAYALGIPHGRGGAPVAPATSTPPRVTPSPSVTPTATPSPNRTTAPAAAMLPAGKVGSRSTVPWSLVGPGWSLVTYTTAPDIVPAPRSAPQTLYLVDPAGGRYTMYTWPSFRQAWQLLDWSGDKARALFETTQPGGTTRLYQLTLSTGAAISLPVPLTPNEAVSYTNPDGTNLLALTGTPSVAKAQRLSLNGTLKVTFATGPHVTLPVDSPDGTQVAIGTGTGIKFVSNAAGGGHVITVPGVNGCGAVRWWNATTVLASCMPNAKSEIRQLWLVPVTGTRPAALTPVRSSSGPDLGDVDAWKLPSGLYLQALGACGSEFIAHQASNGSITRVEGGSGNNQVITAVGDRLLVYAHGACPATGSLLWLNPATGAAQTLIAQPPGERGVTAVAAYRETGN